MNAKKKVILDTNIFVKLDDERIEPRLVKSKFEIYSTNAQLSELTADKNLLRKESRLEYYHKLNPIKLNLKSGIWLDKLIWNDEQPWIDEINSVVEDIRGNSDKTNTWIDALIAEVAKSNNLILVTHEKKIAERAGRNGIIVLDFDAFKILIENNQPVADSPNL